MHLPRFVGTVTFKLAMIQGALFLVSAAVLFAAVDWNMINFSVTQLRSEISAEAAAMAEERVTDGINELVKTVELRTRERSSDGHGYLIAGPDGKALAGRLPPSMLKPGWQELPPHFQPTPMGDDEPHATLAFGQRLPTGEFIVAARDMRAVDTVKEVISQTFALSAAVTLIVAIIGGVITSLGFLRRMEAITATTHRIMAGDLNKRVPTEGTGNEFDRLATNLNAMLERIQSLMEGLRQVSNDIAHDLRTPLTHMRQRLEQAQSDADHGKASETIVEETIEDTDAILKMFAALLRIAQIEAGTRKSGFADVDLSRVAANIIEIYGAVAEDNGQSLSAEIAPDLLVRGDRELLLQMLANLIENAIRHGGPGAEIRLKLSRGRTGPRIVVSDNGPGIASDMRDKVFRRFFRVESNRTSEGSGLGLALVRAVVDLHGIAIELADNRPGLVVELRFSAASAIEEHRPS